MKQSLMDMWLMIRCELVVTLFLVAVFFLGCSHPVKPNRSLTELEEDIRRNNALVTLDSNNVAAHRALGDAYLEQAKIQQRLFRTRKQEWPYSNGYLRYDLRGLDKAILHLTAACRRDSLNDTLWAELARAYLSRYGMGRIAYFGYDWKMKRETVKLVQKALTLNPQSPLANFVMGVLSYNYRHPERALECFQRAVDAKPDFAEALLTMGDVYSGLGDFLVVEGFEGQMKSQLLAHSFWRRAINAGLSDPEAYLSLGYSDPNWRLGPYYLLSIRNVPFIARGLFVLGSRAFLASSEDWEYKMWSRAYQLDSISSKTISSYGRVCWLQGDTAKAIECYLRSDLHDYWYNERFYKRVIAEHPDFVSAYVDFARQVSYRRPDTSIVLLKKAISLDPTRGDAHVELFDTYREKGVPDSAISTLQKYVDAPKPDTAYDAYRDLGWLYLRKQDLKSFKHLFETAGIAKSFVLGAYLLTDWRDFRHASVLKSTTRAYESLLGNDPRSNALVYSALADIASNANDSTASLFYREQVYRSDPKTEWAGPSLAGMYMERHMYEPALKLLSDLLKSNPEDADMLYSKALALDQLGRKKEASVYYRQVAEMDSDAADDSYWDANRLPNSPYQVTRYQRAARLGHKAAQDTLKSRNISW